MKLQHETSNYKLKFMIKITVQENISWYVFKPSVIKIWNDLLEMSNYTHRNANCTTVEHG